MPAGAIQGKVVTSFRDENGKMTLYINQGSKAKVKTGMSGQILIGAEGGEKLEGATFKVVKVVSDSQSVATTDYSKPLGKNNRFYIPKGK